MQIKWKGNLVDEILAQPGDITCHSQFTHGVNLRIADQLLFIGDDQKGCVPFGLHLPTAEFQRANQLINWQEPIKRTPTGLSLGQLRLNVSNCPSFNNRLTLERNETLRLSESIKQLLGGSLEGTGFDFSPLLADLIFNEANLTAQSSGDFITYFIGRGLGLTPAGDDFIIGLLAVDTVESFLPADFRSLLSGALAAKRTTDVSESYLASASQGCFSSLVIEVIKHVSRPISDLKAAVSALADSGSTSGSDTLAGIYYGLQHSQHKTVSR